MSALTILRKVEQEGLRLEARDGKLKVLAPHGKSVPDSLIPELKNYKQEILKHFEAESIRQAITRLQLNETDAIRLYSETCQGEFLIVRDKDTLSKLDGVINVDCPTFTLPELAELIGQDKEMIEKVYMVKAAFGGSQVVTETLKKAGRPRTVAVTEG